MRQEFPAKVKVQAYERCKGRCEICGGVLSVGKFHYDHRLPDALGGYPDPDNCQVLCAACHGGKTAQADVPQIAKANRQRAKHIGAVKRKWQSKWKRKADGTVVLREPK